LALRRKDDLGRIDPILDELPRVLEAAANPPPRGKAPRAAAARRELSREEWSALVESIREGIEEGLFSKVVAALRTDLDLGEAVDPLAVFGRLDRSHPDCHRFLFRKGDAAFLGASPERLVRKDGREIGTEALAGSIDTADTEDENRLRTIRLMESRKDLGEHELVVDAIRRKLEPLCSELRVPARPQIRRLRHVLHLHTPMNGVLAHETHILNLAASLHPTPSVGGVPTSDAVRWIVKNEPHRRGWYAGPVGWFDSEGNGDLAVAIRSGVVRGRWAHLYAGAGIVRDSDPSMEYEETRTKQRPMLRALGIVD
ncbi:MAG: isochorismate synthase, partial [Candidatus Eisenbacteria bacterium]